MQRVNGRKSYTVAQEPRTPRWRKWLMALVGLAAAGCSVQPGMMMAATPSAVMYVVDPAAPLAGVPGTTDAWPLNAARLPAQQQDLQRCVDHAAASLRGVQGDDFRMLRFEDEGLLNQRMNAYVGGQYVATIQDGYGYWYGRNGNLGEYRKVHFHCLQDEAGRVVYSFVRAQ